MQMIFLDVLSAQIQTLRLKSVQAASKAISKIQLHRRAQVLEIIKKTPCFIQKNNNFRVIFVCDTINQLAMQNARHVRVSMIIAHRAMILISSLQIATVRIANSILTVTLSAKVMKIIIFTHLPLFHLFFLLLSSLIFQQILFVSSLRLLSLM